MLEQEQRAPVSPEEDVYVGLTPTSHEYFAAGREHLPGGDSRSPLFYAPYPAVLAEGHGCRLTDVDGNQLLDFTSNHSSLILGYGHPQVHDAVRRQLDAGTCFPGPTAPQYTLARQLCERVESLEQVRFVNSGTEAVLQAVRAARAFTGRDRLAKIEGGYNGTADTVLVSTSPSLEQLGSEARPAAVPGSLGLAPASVENMLVLPFNDVDGAKRLLEEQGDELAAVIAEPVMGAAGMIPAEQDYLEMLRDVTRRMGILLVFDEVISFRVAFGGAQQHYGVSADLTCLGKMLGGGFPLGAFGGRADVMAMFDPSRTRPQIPHPGSLNANPVSLVAGSATLEVMTEETIAELNRRGSELRARIAEVFEDAGIAVQVTGLGSLFAIHFTAEPVRDYRGMMRADADLRHRLFLGLFNEGVMIDPRGVGCVSLATADSEIDFFIAALRSLAPRLATPAHVAGTSTS